MDAGRFKKPWKGSGALTRRTPDRPFCRAKLGSSTRIPATRRWSQNIFTEPDWSGDLQLQSLDDIGIIVLDEPVTGIEPADIAPIGYLDGTPRGTLFTVVGYGVRYGKPESGPQKPVSTADRERRFTVAPLSNLTSDTIMLATNPNDKRGGGGTCFGDSGGPIFLNGYLVGVTSWGTSQFCTAGQGGYQRLDTQDAFEFYGPFLDAAGA